MARPVDAARRARLLEAAVDYTIERGISGLSLRPLAAALEVTPTTLVHHFGSKEDLLQLIVNRVRARIVEDLDLDGSPAADAATIVREAWAWSADPSHDAVFRLVFEVYGRALQEPHRFSAFLDHVVADWVGLLRTRLESEGHSRASAERHATLSLAVVRGLLLDLLTTDDRERVADAMAAFASWLDETSVTTPSDESANERTRARARVL